MKEQLVGYDIMNGTNYDIDIFKVPMPGTVNKLAGLITDPECNFEWLDLAPLTWGEYKISTSHGFGVITDNV